MKSTAPMLTVPAGWRNDLSDFDQCWIAKALFRFGRKGQSEMDYDRIDRMWWYPPQPLTTVTQPPTVDLYFAHRLLLWMPWKLWQVKLVCPFVDCIGDELTSAGIHQKLRRVYDISNIYYVAAEYFECQRCKRNVVSWSENILSQLDMGHRVQFPCIMTSKLACDKKVVRLLRQRGLGNSSQQVQKKLQEQYSEAWLNQVSRYLTECEGFAVTQKSSLIVSPTFVKPPEQVQVPLYKSLMHVYVSDVLSRLDEVKASITSQFGTILKMVSTKKIVKKLSGKAAGTAMWATNVGNEHGQVIQSVLTSGEGYCLGPMIAGIIGRYQIAGVPAPVILYVDRDCCGNNILRRSFSNWSRMVIRLDIWRFMSRIAVGCTSNSHRLYASFMSHVSRCIFEWDPEDLKLLLKAKREQLRTQFIFGSSDEDILSQISRQELALHCKRVTRGTVKTTQLLKALLTSFAGDKGKDTLGVPLINGPQMAEIWESQVKHIGCIQDHPGVKLYSLVGQKKMGLHMLPVYRCARGSASLESFHLHLSRFIPGSLADASFQAYLVEGLVRWNEDSAVSEKNSCHSYSGTLRHHVNQLSQAVFGRDIVSGCHAPLTYTGELIGIEYLYSQTGEVLVDFMSLLEREADEVNQEDTGSEDDVNVDETSDQSENFDPTIAPIDDECDFLSLLAFEVPTVTEAVKETLVHDDLIVASKSPDISKISGYDEVELLADKLVSLVDHSLVLSSTEADALINLWHGLADYDKRRINFSPRHQSHLNKSRFRATKRIVTPGVESTKCCFLGPNSTTTPDCNRYVEVVIIKLCELYPGSGCGSDNRWTLVSQAYKNIREVVLNSDTVMERTSIQIPELYQSTITQWFINRSKSQDENVLNRCLSLPEPPMASERILPPAREKPSFLSKGSSVESFNFHSSPNTAGSAKLKKWQKPTATVTQSDIARTANNTRPVVQTPDMSMPRASVESSLNRTASTQLLTASPYIGPTAGVVSSQGDTLHTLLVFPVNTVPSCSVVISNTAPAPVISKPLSYTTRRYRKKRLAEEKAGVVRRKYTKRAIVAICPKCEKPRTPPLHIQYFGNWFCEETSHVTLQQWKEVLLARGYGKRKLPD